MEAISCFKAVRLPNQSNGYLKNPSSAHMSKAGERKILGFQAKNMGATLIKCHGGIEFIKFNYPIGGSSHRRSIPRNVITHSDVAGASSHPLVEIGLISRLRGISFYCVTALVAIVLFIVMLIAHPFVMLFDRYRRKAHHLVAKIWASSTVWPFFNVTFEGLENLPPSSTPAVYVSNHQSFLDIYSLLMLGRTFKFISKTSIFIFPIVGWAMFLMGLIPLRRMDSRSQLDCLKRCVELVRKGASVFFFPEGTRSKDGKLTTFKVSGKPRKGAFTVAMKTGAPVVPITLMGTGELMPAGMEGVLNRGSVKVVIHKPINGDNADDLCGKARSCIADTLILHGYKVHEK